MTTLDERLERLQLAWAVLRDSDDALVDHVRREIGSVDADLVLHCVNIARVFALKGHSGASAAIVIPWLRRALSWEPVAPLTGAEDEWVDLAEVCGRALWQNRRCGRVFKEGDGTAYDVEGRVFRKPSGACFTKQPESRVSVTFPYLPSTEVVEFDA